MSKYAVNLLALPKDPAIMKCFIAPEGCVLGQMDISSLEPHVLTYMSKDPTLQQIYGKDAWPHHDIYFVAGMLIPKIGERIREHYTLENPTLEGVTTLKQEMGEIRKRLLKPCYLGWSYGLGKHTLATSANITVKEAQKILTGLDNQFKGKRWLQDHLTKQWTKNGGYVINGRGLPICVDYGKIRDIVNRVIQSTGHDIFVRIMYHFNVYRREHNFRIRPYIPDYHDETIWAVEEGYEDQFRECVEQAFTRINEELNWDGVMFKHGGINFGTTLEVRCED